MRNALQTPSTQQFKWRDWTALIDLFIRNDGPPITSPHRCDEANPAEDYGYNGHYFLIKVVGLHPVTCERQQ